MLTQIDEVAKVKEGEFKIELRGIVILSCAMWGMSWLMVKFCGG